MERALSDRMTICVSNDEICIQKIYDVKIKREEWVTLKSHRSEIEAALANGTSWAGSWSPHWYMANARRVEVMPQGYVILRMARGVKPMYMNVTEWNKFMAMTSDIDDALTGSI